MSKLLDFFNPKYNDGVAVQAIMEEKAPRKYESEADLISAMYTAQQGQGYLSEYSWRELVASYTSWVFTSIDKIAKTVAGAPKRLYAYQNVRTGKFVPCTEFKSVLRSLTNDLDRYRYLKDVGKIAKRIEITDNPCIVLLNKPNAIDTQFIFWMEIMQRLELAGSCGIYQVLGPHGVPSELWVLPTSENGEFKPKPDPKLGISGYHYSDGDVNEDFTLEQATWLRYPNPKNKFEGMSALKAQILPYNIDYYLAKQQYRFFKNNAIIGNILETDKKMGQAELDKLYDKLEDKYQGDANTWKWLILHSGLKAGQPQSAAAKDMMLDVIGKYAKDKMLSAFGVNEGMVGLTENQNKANLDTSRENYLIECIAPRVQLITETFERGIVDKFDERLEFEIELPQIQQRELNVAERNINLTTFTTTINEERAKMKMEPVEWGDKPFVPFNLTQLGEEKPAPAAVPAPILAPVEPPPKKNIEIPAETKINRDAEWKVFDARARECEPMFVKVMQKIFKEQLAEVLENLKKRGAVVKGRMATQNVRQWLLEHKGETARLNIDRKAWEKETAKRVRPAFVETLRTAGNKRIKEFSKLKAEIEFDLTGEVTVKWLQSKLEKFSGEVTGTTYDAVEEVLRKGLEGNETLVEMSADLRAEFDVFDVSRANTIARTESASAYNEGDIEAVRQMGLEDKVLKTWLNEPDARPTHQQAGKDYEGGVPLDEDFEVGDDVMDVPGNGQLAEENINCRCTLGYVKS